MADAGATTVLAHAPLAVMLADDGAPAVLADSALAVMLADAGAPTALAPSPAAVMLADAGAPAVLAPAPLAVVLALLARPCGALSRCLCLPLPPPTPTSLRHRLVGRLPRRVAISPLLAALVALAPPLPESAPAPLPPSCATGPTGSLGPFAARTARLNADPRGQGCQVGWKVLLGHWVQQRWSFGERTRRTRAGEDEVEPHADR
jgi:hypothetical protein